MLREIRDALLGDDHVRPARDDLGADVLDVLFLHAEQLVPVLLLLDRDVGRRVALLVLERAVQQEDARPLDAATHARVRHVLVEHHPAQDAALARLAARDLLDLCVPLDVDFLLPRRRRRLLPTRLLRDRAGLPHDPQRRLERHRDDQVAPARGELGPHARLDQLEHGGFVLERERLRHAVARLQRRLQRERVPARDHRRVQVPLQARNRRFQHLPGQHDHRGRPVPDLLVLGPRQLDHLLRRRVRHVHLAENRVAVVRQHHAAHRIQ
mmetsp:Transcript_12621/g.40041  ORF Transcript_12621/g.40041 Transcript_12621/m.40041 type:complete len:268 (+) Transcript_12621:1671-2474(+)